MFFKKLVTKFNLLFILIILFTVFLYFYRLSNIPSGFYSDEAAIAYNAYSILQTGRDEYGQSFPILFKFFGSYTPGLFVYLLVPIIKIFGLSVTTIRGTNAILMILSGIIFYLILKEYFPKKNKYLLLLPLLLYYLTPWSVFNARLAYETTFAYFLFCLATYFLTKKKISLAFLLLSLSTYAAHPYRYLAPMIILAYLIVFRPSFKTIYKAFLGAFLLQIPHFYLVFTPAFWVKGAYLNLNFIHQYLTFFSPSNLFASEDPDLQRSVPQIAIFYFWQFVPLIVGLKLLFQRRREYLSKLIILILLLSPLPAAFANANYATQRAIALLLPYSLIISMGIISLWKFLISKILILILIPFSFLLLWRSYFIFLPKDRAAQWYAGFEKMTEFIVQHPDWHFVIDDSRHIPHIEYLFFSEYSPQKFQQETGILENYYSNTSFIAHRDFANIETRPLIWQDDIYLPQVLIADQNVFTDSIVAEHCLQKVFEYDNYYGQALFLGYKTNPQLKRNGCHEVK